MSSGKAQKPPTGKPWIWLTAELVQSAAWQSLGINARRFVDFLMAEHMRHAGQDNGFLLAPWRQLQQAGIGARHIGPAIEETTKAGIVDCIRGVGRAPSRYSLSWLPLADGTEPSNRWKVAVVPPEGKVLHMPSQGNAASARREGTKPVAPSQGNAQTPQKVPSEGKAPLRYLAKAKPSGGRGASLSRSAEYAQPEAPDDLPWYGDSE